MDEFRGIHVWPSTDTRDKLRQAGRFGVRRGDGAGVSQGGELSPPSLRLDVSASSRWQGGPSLHPVSLSIQAASPSTSPSIT